MSDQPDAESSTCRHTTLTTHIDASGGIRTLHPRKRAAAESRLRLRSHWDRLTVFILEKIMRIIRSNY